MTAKNIEGVLKLANLSDWQIGGEWYTQAGNICHEIANNYGLQGGHPTIGWQTTAAVMAALSPNNRWERNCADTELVIRLYKAGGAEAALQAKVCTYKANLKKAVAILEGGDPIATLKGPKVTEFYQCIIGSVAEVCIDGHAYAIWVGERLTMKKIPSIGKKLRDTIKADYIKVAKKYDLPASTIQAVTWVCWRRLHGI